MTDTKIAAEHARTLVTLLVEDAVYVDHSEIHGTLLSYIDQFECEIATMQGRIDDLEVQCAVLRLNRRGRR